MSHQEIHFDLISFSIFQVKKKKKKAFLDHIQAMKTLS